ncbi:MAG: hypothetical protein FD180_2044 [Planctomycetota bacterium]|nr:MAG: hypothetical protein FD180_2044 [Planctomycetota bacterium]
MGDLAGTLLVGSSAVLGSALAAMAVFSKRLTRPLDRRPALAALVPALVALGISAGLGLIRPPVPQIHDEFSYLLAADTYASGHLAARAPSSPEHFESFHVLTTPTHASKYFPGQGLVLALGIALLGSPIAGAWIVFAAACAALHWALRVTIPARFALAVALLAALHPPFHDDPLHPWTQSFWGGQLAFLGGALVFGAAARLARRARFADGFAAGAGLSVLALARPFEGIIAALMAAGLCFSVFRKRAGPSPKEALRRFALPALAPPVVALAFVLFVNARVTGSALRLPEALYEERFASAPVFLWMSAPAAKQYSSADVKNFYEADRSDWEARRRPSALPGEMAARIRDLARYFLKPMAWVWLALPLVLFLPRARRIAALAAAGTAVALTVSWMHPHYVAVYIPLGAELAARCLRCLSNLARPWRFAGVAAIALSLGGISVRLLEAPQGAARSRNEAVWPEARAALERRLEATGTPHLVLVERRGGWPVHCDWVYNGPGIAARPVVWARSLGSARDAALVSEFPGRVVLQLVLDEQGWNIRPWRPGG